MSELHDLSALEQAAGMRRRAFSPVELLDHYERRADALDATVGAFITRTHDLALAQARAAERRILAAVPGEPLGPLYGTVVPPKDLDAGGRRPLHATAPRRTTTSRPRTTAS